MKYVITLRETTVQKFVIETDETDPSEIEQEFWELDEDARENPGGADYRDSYNSEIESVEPFTPGVATALKAEGTSPQHVSLTCEARVALVYEVLDTCVGHTSSILSEAGDLGGQMAYLMGSICNTGNEGAGIELEEGDDVLDFFKMTFPDDHAVWGFIEVTFDPSAEKGVGRAADSRRD